MADRYLTDPKLYDGNVEYYAAVGEQITIPYSLDALNGLVLRPGARFLEVAAGTEALAMAAAGRGAGVLATDSSPAMVAYLAARGVGGAHEPRRERIGPGSGERVRGQILAS